jgi:hypothetical protein
VVSTQRRLAVVFAVVVAFGAVLAYAFFARGGDETKRVVGLPIGSEGIAARTSISPRGELFGDNLTARLDLLIDREVIDPATITIETDFKPFRETREPRLERTDHERLTRLRYFVSLECLTDACAPRSTRKEVKFEPAQVRSRGKLVQRPRWPVLTLGSRLQNPTTDPRDEFNPRTREPTSGLDWRAEVRVAAPTWRIEPTQATVLLVGLALVLLGASLFLLTNAYPGLARRLWRRPAKLTPLERALAALQHAHQQGAEREHRVALDDLATELRAVGAPELAGTAYALAWDAPPPEPERTEGLTEQVRELIVGRSNGHP